jgi:NAD(P) transhydrogenase subunit alpha
MDALSSQANIAGYKAVLLAAETLPKVFPLLTTAAGTIAPARVFVVGAGVAGLSAIATARRLGAVVEAYDVREAAKEEVQSLGARFVELPLETGQEGAGSGAYATAMSDEALARQRELMLKTVAASDVVITTAQVQGKRAPVLVTEEMVRAMSPGSVVIDLAAEQGGNCELTRPGKTVVEGGVTIHGPLNLPSALPAQASQLYTRNLIAFAGLLIKDGKFALNLDDELVRGSLVLDAGKAPKAAEAAAAGGQK